MPGLAGFSWQIKRRRLCVPEPIFLGGSRRVDDLQPGDAGLANL
jgi:hypothetical protein